MVTNEQRVTNEKLEEINKEISGILDEDPEIKEMLGEGENEDIKVIFELMTKEDKKKLIESGLSVEEVRKFLSNFMKIYDLVISEMDDYGSKEKMMLQLLHIHMNNTASSMYKKMNEAMKDDPDITLKKFYNESHKKYKSKVKDSFEASEYDDKNYRYMKFITKMIIASFALIDLQKEK